MGSALDSASLIMYPSGYSDGVLGSAKPTDGSGDFTFSRGSNLSATRVAPNGYIEKGYENLLTYSNDFSNAAWTKFNTSVTSGQAGYDGSNDAWSLIPNVSNSTHYIDYRGLSTNGVYSVSFYAKANGYNYFYLNTAGVFMVVYDLQNGIITSNQSKISAAIDSVGNGWYRCTYITTMPYANFRAGVSSSESNTIFTGDGTSGVLIQDAMLNQGLVAYPYVETTTAPVAGGILEDEPRIDFSDGCGHLLLEPSRTNVVPHSEYFDTYTKGGNAEIENNSILSPEGVQNASKFYSSTTSLTFSRIESSSVATGRTMSVFAKAGEISEFLFLGENPNEGPYFNLNDGSISGYYLDRTDGIENAYSIDYGNGWYRCVVTFSTNKEVRLFLSENQDITFNQTAGNGIYIYGLQLEQDATYPTSYIPTYGSSQTRLVDNCNVSNVASLIGQTEGTIFMEYLPPVSTSGLFWLQVRETGGFDNWIFMGTDDNRYRFYAEFNNSNQLSFLTPKVNGLQKMCISYNQSTGVNAFLNGIKVATSTNSFTISNPLSIVEFKPQTLQTSESGSVNQALVFPTALSDSECIALTTI